MDPDIDAYRISPEAKKIYEEQAGFPTTMTSSSTLPIGKHSDERRERIATAAMGGVLGALYKWSSATADSQRKALANWSVMMADDLIAALEAKPK